MAPFPFLIVINLIDIDSNSEFSFLNNKYTKKYFWTCFRKGRTACVTSSV